MPRYHYDFFSSLFTVCRLISSLDVILQPVTKILHQLIIDVSCPSLDIIEAADNHRYKVSVGLLVGIGQIALLLLVRKMLHNQRGEGFEGFQCLCVAQGINGSEEA